MTRYTIHSDGQITLDGTVVPARISCGSPKLLRWGGKEVDVTHVWHANQLPEIVTAVLSGSPLPYGYHWRVRTDGVSMIGTGDLGLSGAGYSFSAEA